MVWVVVRETDHVTSTCVVEDIVEITALSVNIPHNLHGDHHGIKAI